MARQIHTAPTNWGEEMAKANSNAEELYAAVEDLQVGKVGATIGRRVHGTVVVPNVTDTVVKFHNADSSSTRNAENCGITYEPATGIFRNTTGKTSIFLVNYHIMFPAQVGGGRTAWVQYGNQAGNKLAPSYAPSHEQHKGFLNGSCIIDLLNGDFFQIMVHQNSTVQMYLGGAEVGFIYGHTDRIQVTRMTA